MGCRSDYMEPNEREKESVLVCHLLIFAFTELKRKIPQDVVSAAMATYGDVVRLDEHTALLCDTCANMSVRYCERIIYNGRSPDSRRLADWWDRHQEADKKRIDEEMGKKKNEVLVKSAKSKLSLEELEALVVDALQNVKLGGSNES